MYINVCTYLYKFTHRQTHTHTIMGGMRGGRVNWLSVLQHSDRGFSPKGVIITESVF